VWLPRLLRNELMVGVGKKDCINALAGDSIAPWVSMLLLSLRSRGRAIWVG
jgi:hypothetical protein